MTEEMLSPDVFERKEPWKTTVHIKHLLTDDEDLTCEQINAKAKQIVAALKHCSLFEDEDILAALDVADELDEFNGILEEIYNYCDLVRIWVA